MTGAIVTVDGLIECDLRRVTFFDSSAIHALVNATAGTSPG